MKKQLGKIVFGLIIFSSIFFAAPNVFAASNSTQLLKTLDLSQSDIRIYQKIFTAIRQQNFKEVSRLNKKLDNQILEGHILAQTYLSKSYKSTYNELSDWLEQYADLPQATRIRRLAERKNPNKPPSFRMNIRKHIIFPRQIKSFNHLINPFL